MPGQGVSRCLPRCECKPVIVGVGLMRWGPQGAAPADDESMKPKLFHGLAQLAEFAQTRHAPQQLVGLLVEALIAVVERNDHVMLPGWVFRARLQLLLHHVAEVLCMPAALGPKSEGALVREAKCGEDRAFEVDLTS